MVARDYAVVFRSRWLAIAGAMLVIVLAALTYSLATTPKYRAETRIFVATSTDSSREAYQSTLASEQRIATYTRLLEGTALARRTIDALGLPMTPEELRSEITVTSASNTVILDVWIRDESPVRAQNIANGLGAQFAAMVAELETPMDGGPPNIRASPVDEADQITAVTEPRTLRNLLAGIAIGLLAGLGVAIIRHRLDNTVQDGPALAAAIKSPVLAILPDDEQRGIGAEQFRQLAISLKYTDVDSPPTVLVVTGSVRGDGATSVAIGLARALGERGHRVVIVDADLRRPRVAECVNVSDAAGVTSIVSGEATVNDVVQKTGYRHVWAVASGPIPPNANELVGSAATGTFLDYLRAAFDYVIVDSPPLVPVSDAAVLATKTDGVLLVARYGCATMPDVERAATSVRNVGARVLGLVVSGAPRGAHDAQATNEYMLGNVGTRG